MRGLLAFALLFAPLAAQQVTTAPAVSAANADAAFRAAIASLQAKQYKEADAGFRRLWESEPDHVRGLVGIAEVAMAQGQVEQAIGLVRAESAKTPARADFHVLIGDLEEQAGRHKEALPEYQQALTLMDSRSASDLQVPRGHDPVSALAAPEVLPKGAAGIYLRIASIQIVTADAKAAVVSLRKADELAPGNALIVTDLAVGLEATGEKKSAAENYRAALAINPRSPVALNNLAFLITEIGGDLYEALRFARAAKLLAPQLDEITDTIGWISLKLGWTDEAISTFAGLLLKQPANETGRTHLIAALDQKHPRTPADNELKSALEARATPENQKAVSDLLNRGYRPK